MYLLCDLDVDGCIFFVTWMLMDFFVTWMLTDVSSL